MSKVKTSDPCCLCCCRPKSQHIARDLQCPETVYFIENDLGPSATRLEALQAQPVGEESGWLVEMVEPDHNKSPVPRWWHPEHGWMWDANKALRFAREVDAQDYITGSGRLPGKPTEHMFLDSAGGEA